MLETTLAQGGMGTVWRARDDAGQLVALKTVRAAGLEQLESLRSEIATLRALEHPGVVRILDHGAEAGEPWYAMAFVDGLTLRAWIGPSLPMSSSGGVTWTEADDAEFGDEASGEAVPLPPDRRQGVLGLFVSLLETLAWLHARGVVHGDLKPENVIVDPDRVPVLVDFGLATLRRAEREALRFEGRVRGSVHTMAPEQIRAEPLDARADLYAVGCMLYDALAGRPMFPLPDPFQVVRAQLADTPPPLETLAPGLPPALVALIHALITKDRERRPGQAAEVAQALAAAAGLPVRPLAAPPVLFRPRLRGRADELDELTGDTTTSEGPSVIVVTGPSGVGKTRLVQEVMIQHVREGARVLVAAARLETRRVPLGGLADVLRFLEDALRAEEIDPDDDLARLAPYHPGLAEALDHPEPKDPPGVLPEAARERALKALARTLSELGRYHGTWLLLDDAQWADDLTAAFVRGLVEGRWVPHAPRMIATLRDDDDESGLHAALADAGARTLPLRALSPAAAAELVADMLAQPAPALAAVVHPVAEGQPFVVAEAVRAALDVGAIERVDGAWRERPDRFERLPTTATDLLGRRLDALSLAGRAVADALSVVGRDGAVLARVVDAAALRAGLEELRAAGLLGPAEEGVALAHDSLRKVAYEALADDQRRALHAQAAACLRGQAGAEAVVARHLERADRPEEAAVARVAAAREALRRHALPIAEHHARRALSAVDPATRDDARRIWILALEAAGRHAELEAAAAWLVDDPAPDQVDGQLVALASLVVAARECGKIPRAEELAERRLALARRHGRGDAAGQSLNQLAVLDLIRGRVAQADERLAAVSPDDIVGPMGRATFSSTRGVCAAMSGSSDVALGWFREAASAFREAGDVRKSAHELLNVGKANVELCRYAEARPPFEEALDLLRAVGDRKHEGMALHALGQLHLKLGDLVAAERCLFGGNLLLDAANATRQHAFGSHQLGIVRFLLGRWDDAVAGLTHAEALYDRVGSAAMALASRLLAVEIRARQGRPASPVEMPEELPDELRLLALRVRRLLGLPVERAVFEGIFARAVADGDPEVAVEAACELALTAPPEDRARWADEARRHAEPLPHGPTTLIGARLAELEGG